MQEVERSRSQGREDPVVIEKILRHLEHKDAAATATRSPPSRAPPQVSLFG